ncbi:hypothetical protein [Pseudomonas aeruginosa]|uniref:hypothetical protein n=1 Tax=Pseudomonas aeruginosa TaxID=287 RepID=UPI0021B1A13E|nr:hypothetical protein [Pseudomonas aeruginosa]MCT7418366.1 hypothetical protein [Pseudomonas aeruginosa]
MAKYTTDGGIDWNALPACAKKSGTGSHWKNFTIPETACETHTQVEQEEAPKIIKRILRPLKEAPDSLKCAERNLSPFESVV